MDLFVVRGGNRLGGRVAVSGSKNATLPIMAASLMLDGETVLEGVPQLADVTTLAQVLRSLGVRVSPAPASRTHGVHTLAVSVEDDARCVASYELVRRMRASICVLGPLLAKRGRAVVSLPGGCNIGDRPVDVHLRGLSALGADLRLERGYVVGTTKGLIGTEIDLAGPRGSTVTGTANLLMAATLAKGRTILHHAACEPEIADLAHFLVAAGANIGGIDTPTLDVTGVETLNAVTHRVIPDRIEAATLMVAAAITAGDVTLDGVRSSHLVTVLQKLRDAGAEVEVLATDEPTAVGGESVRVRTIEPLRPVDIETAPYPGFPTDLQAQWTALMTTARGTSRVTDLVFPDRFLHLPELSRLGARLRRESSVAVVTGGQRLRGANLMASDLRASAALVLAALASEGESVIRRIYHLDRGYERLDQKLSALGANVARCIDDVEIAVSPPLPAA